MGFLDKIKSIFKEQKEETKEEVKYEELEIWINLKLDKENKKLDSELEELKNKVNEEKQNLKKKIQELQAAELKNKDIPERVKQVMEGNRETFIQKIHVLLNQTISPQSPSKITDFADDFDKTMSNFDKGIAKSYHVVSEFFPKEAGAITGSMRNLDKLVKDSKKIIESSEINKFNKVRSGLKELEEKIKYKDKIKSRSESLKEEIKESINQEKEKQKNLEKLEKSKENIAYNELKESKEELQNRNSKLEGELYHNFSMVETSLKKYFKLSENKLVKSYLENPLQSIFSDNDLQIIDILDNIRKTILRGELDLKDKKKDKTLRELGKLSEGYFQDFLKKHKESSEELKELTSEIEKITIDKEIKKAKEELFAAKEKLEETNQTIGKLEREFEEINIDDLKQKLKAEVSEKFQNIIIVGN